MVTQEMHNNANSTIQQHSSNSNGTLKQRNGHSQAQSSVASFPDTLPMMDSNGNLTHDGHFHSAINSEQALTEESAASVRKNVASVDEQEVAAVLSHMATNGITSVNTAKDTFFARVSGLPVVTSTMRTIGEVYGASKQNSRVIKSSAETVERLLDTTKPVLGRVMTSVSFDEPRLDRLDEFACRQLDRLEKSYPIITQSPSTMYSSSKQVLGDAISKWSPSNYTSSSGEGNVVSRFNSYLSTESVKSLKYCLEWLQYATAHIDHQIHVLQEGLGGWVATNSDSLKALVGLATQVKREVVETLRRVVDILSKYAGSALPLESRNMVRGFILSLPNRWASINGTLVSQAPCANNSVPEANRVLTLAEEINGTLKSTMGVFSQAVITGQYWFGASNNSENAAANNDSVPMDTSM